MKRIINILFAAVLLIGFATSCEVSKTGNQNVAVQIVAEWQLTEMSTYVSLPAQVYVEFKEDGTFDIYQKVGDVARYSKLSGVYALTESIMTGEYNDGEELGSAYRISFEAEGEVLVMTAVTLDEAGAVVDYIETLKYTKASLPQEEKDDANVITKSTDSELFYIL